MVYLNHQKESKKKGETKMFTIQLKYKNRNEFMVYQSEWASKQIALRWLKQDPEVQKVYIINNDTYEVKEVSRKRD